MAAVENSPRKVSSKMGKTSIDLTFLKTDIIADLSLKKFLKTLNMPSLFDILGNRLC